MLHLVSVIKARCVIDMCIHLIPLCVVQVVDLHVRAGAVATTTMDVFSEERLAAVIESCWEG
jgi:hypothetical protein